MRQRQINLTGKLRVLAAFHPLYESPEPFPVGQERRCTFWQNNVGLHDAAPATVVVDLLRPVIGKALTRTIGCRRKGRPPLRSLDDLYRKMIARHRGELSRSESAVNKSSNLSDNVASVPKAVSITYVGAADV